MKLFFAITLLLFNLHIFGQGTISGKVIDGNSKEALFGVSVSVVDEENGASTEENGKFEITDIGPGAYRLEFSYIGYKTVIISDLMVMVGKPSILNVSLSEELLESEGVTVTAGYFNNTYNNAATSIIGLSREEIRRFPGGFEDVVRTVTTLPGVTVQNDGGRNDLLVRGGGPSENLYTINNIEVPNINHFGTQGFGSGSLSFINLDFIDNVEFSTGGFNVKYGDKLSSVMSLETTRGRNDRLGGKALISATQFGLNLEGPVSSNGDFIFSARKSYLDLIFKANGLPFIPTYTDYNLLLDFDLSPNDQLFIMGLAAIDNIERNLDDPKGRTVNAGIMDNTQDQYISGFNYRHLMDKGYMDVTFSYINNQYFFAQNDTAGVQYFKSNAKENEAGLKVSGFYGLSKSIRILAGAGGKMVLNDNETNFADYIYDKSGNRIPIDITGLPQKLELNETFKKYYAFAEFDWNPVNKMQINFGVRGDYYDPLKNKFYFSPRLGLQYQLTPEVNLKGSIGRYFQSPSNVWLVNENNKSLQALKNDMYILSVDYRLFEDTKIIVEGYYKNYSDLPTGTIAGVDDYYVLTNTGASYGGQDDNFQSFGYNNLLSNAYGNAYGLEISAQKKFSDTPFYYQLSLSLGRSEYTAGNGITYPGQYDQRFIFNLAGGYVINNNWEVSGKFRVFSGTPYTPQYRPSENPVNPGSVENVPQEYLSDRLNTSHHLDVRVDRYFYYSNWSLIVFLDIQNIYNNKLPVRPRYDFWEDEIRNSGGIGILPSIGISATF